ncbi:MAG: hypothetical protein K5739_07305 [Lachnospiraceae bacterium]|nr:hypothetical protein [Lachnospiraceae bacterium]
MIEKKSKFAVFLTVMLVIQVVIMFLIYAFAFFGDINGIQAMNIWAVLWGKGLAIWLLLSNTISFVAAIIGLATGKGIKSKIILSIVLIITTLVNLFGLILAIGSKF